MLPDLQNSIAFPVMNIKWTDKDYKWRTMENHQTETNRNSDKKKKMELDRTHIT